MNNLYITERRSRFVTFVIGSFACTKRRMSLVRGTDNDAVSHLIIYAQR